MGYVTKDIDIRLGQRLYELRVERGLSLDDVAERSEVSRASLSRVERAESSPTAQLLARICAGLGVTLSALFAQAEPRPGPVARRAAQTVWQDPDTGYVRRNVSPTGTGSAVEIVEVEFPPGGSVVFDNRRAAGVDQHVWVLDGTLDLMSGEQAFRLETGDCLMMRFGHRTAFHNPTDRPTRYAVVVSRAGAGP